MRQLDTVDGLRAWCDALVDLQRSRGARGGCPIGSLAGQLAEHDEGARLELADGLDRWEAAIRQGLQRMAARGELRPGADPGVLAQSTLAAVQGGLLLTQVRRDPDQLRAPSTARIDAIRAARAVDEPPTGRGWASASLERKNSVGLCVRVHDGVASEHCGPMPPARLGPCDSVLLGSIAWTLGSVRARAPFAAPTHGCGR